MIELLAALTLLWAGDDEQSRPMQVSPQELWTSPVGACMSSERRNLMLELVPIEGRSINHFNGSPYTVMLDGERLKTFIDNPHRGRTQRIDQFIERRTDLDLRLYFVQLGERTAIYWKEGYEDRIYRQGVLDLNGEHLSVLCEGRGGIEISH